MDRFIDTKETHLNIPAEELGPPGQHAEFVIVPRLENDPFSSEQKLNDSEPRSFTVRAKLSKNYVNDIYNISDFDNDDGNSFICIKDKSKRILVETQSCKYKMYSNDNKEIGVIEYETTQIYWQSAVLSFYENIMPQLNYHSFQFNTPVYIQRIHCTDNIHGVQIFIYRTPFTNKIMPNHNCSTNVLLFPIYSLFREAVSNNSFFYQLLCYYKILEGIYYSIKPKIAKQIKAKGIEATNKKDILPNDSYIPRQYKQYIGKSVKYIFDSILTPIYRNKVAHYVQKDKEPLNFSMINADIEYSEASYLAKVCCIVLINNTEENFQLLR